MTIYFVNTDSFAWIDTTSFDWLSEDTQSMNVLSGSPVVDQLDVYLPGPVDVLSGIPIVDSLNASVLTPHQFTAKSVIFDFADNWSGDSADALGIRSIEFYFVSNLIELEYNNMHALASSNDGGNYDAARAFYTYLDKDGVAYKFCWRTVSGAITNQRLIVVFDTPQVFDEIKINNYHDAGVDTDWGVKNARIYTSNEAISNTNYKEDIFDYTDIFIGEISQHVASDVEDTTVIPIAVLANMYFITGAPVVESLSAATMDVSTGAPAIDVLTASMAAALESVITLPPVIDELQAEMHLPIICALELEIPISFEMSAGTEISAIMPSLDMEASMHSGRIGDVDITFPSMSLLMEAGNNICATLPELTLSGTLSKEELINISCQLPSLQASFSSSFASNGDIEANLAALQMTISSLTGSAVDLNGIFPKFVMINTLLNGTVGDIDMTLPMIQAEISSIVTGDNDLEATFPGLLLAINADKLSHYALNYVKGKVR